MAGLAISLVAPPGLRGRFARAAAGEPLSALSPAAREELDAILASTADFEDLPGKWQAALARAEAAVAGEVPPAPAPGGSCCGGAR